MIQLRTRLSEVHTRFEVLSAVGLQTAGRGVTGVWVNTKVILLHMDWSCWIAILHFSNS